MARATSSKGGRYREIECIVPRGSVITLSWCAGGHQDLSNAPKGDSVSWEVNPLLAMP